jgi:hypothetical protein
LYGFLANNFEFFAVVQTIYDSIKFHYLLACYFLMMSKRRLIRFGTRLYLASYFKKGCDIFFAKIFSFLEGRLFQVKIGNMYYKSQLHKIPYGVPQGTILSPTLYNILTDNVIPSSLGK